MRVLDVDVQDLKLAEHLARWGIDIMKLEKTDKTMAELEVGRYWWCGALLFVSETIEGCFRLNTSRCHLGHAPMPLGEAGSELRYALCMVLR